MIVTVETRERYPEYELTRGGSEVPGRTKIVERSGGWGTRVCVEMTEPELAEYEQAKRVFDLWHEVIESRIRDLPTLPEIRK